MQPRRVRVGLSLVLLLAALFAGIRGAGPVPPLGGLLEPVRGLWSALATGDLPDSLSADIPGLSEVVDVRYDVRGVPHIFARNDADLARALGYVVARDRLFQLELLARAGAGTLTELVGPVALPADSQARHLGMPRAAERRLAALPSSSTGRRLIEAYAEGVNAWIDHASRADRPVEYKLLATRPARWQPINSLHLFNRMGYTLSYDPVEEMRLAARGLVGPLAAAALFPIVAPIQEPIQPGGTGVPRFATAALPPPGAPDTDIVAMAKALPHPVREYGALDVSRLFASNNWAVSPSRSRSRHALLAGDPHLELTLPSIWYEVHLVIPGSLDTYGVTIPGAPGVIIGFTPFVAWSLTNTGADVHDFYRESVDDQVRPGRYLVDSTWRDIELREEVYLDQRGRTVRVDTVRFTHRGPVQRMGEDWVSMRWTVLEASDPIAPFANGATARTAQEFLDVFAADFFSPVQNAIAADREGNIAIRSTGHFPVRPPGSDGLTIFDGSRSDSDWRGFLPVARYPQALNPTQGFLASANQQPIDPAFDSTYFAPETAFEPWRALQVNRLLRADSSVTLDAMQRMQTDPGSVRADVFVARFRDAARAVARGFEDSLALRSADSLLSSWDRRYTVDNTAAILLESALTEVVRRTWDEFVPAGDSVRVATPTSGILLQLMSDSGSRWWDDRRTTGRREDRDDILRGSLASAYTSLLSRYGSPDTWAWGRVGPARIMHLLRLRGFSEPAVPVQGGRGTLNPAAQSAFGPSWRMVVELGPKVRALGTYPGGQSGNPASARYTDRLPIWASGGLELLFAPAALDSMLPAQVRSALTLRPDGAR
jgi:penicillin amidase